MKKQFFSQNENFKERIGNFLPLPGLYKKHGSIISSFLPPSYLMCVADVELARFLLNLPPDMVKKAGLTKEIFGFDKNGFFENILMSEGEKWQKERKLLSRMLHLDTLEGYIEAMDISAISFNEQLAKRNDFLVIFKFLSLTLLRQT